MIYLKCFCRFAKEALKSYAKTFTEQEHPKDYKLVMRKDVVEEELAGDNDEQFETIEDIELRDKREKVEKREQERTWEHIEIRKDRKGEREREGNRDNGKRRTCG